MASASPRALGDGQVAGVGAGAGDDVARQLGAGLGHADGVEPREQRGQLLLGEPAEHEVLAVGDPHLGAELALDRGEGPELVGGDVAEAGVGVRPTRCPWRRPAPRWPRPSARRAWCRGSRPACPGPSGVGVTPVATPAGGVAVLLHDLGDAAGPGRRGEQELALLDDALAQLVDAHRVDEPLQAGPQLVVAVAVWSNTRRIASSVGSRSSRGRELLEGQRRVRVGAEAAGDEHPEPGLDGAVVEGAGWWR